MIMTIMILLASVSTILGALTLYYHMPMDATVESQVSAQFYVNNQTWTNNTGISWGTVEPGSTYQKSFEVYNDGSTDYQVLMIVQGLPSGWGYTYSRNGTNCVTNNWLNGTLSVTVSGGSSNANYYWSVIIKLQTA